ncbi:MAG: (d)CMP kinase [Alphaproteobacteria bacterium]|nr:(d)CMP kinase [Alphaproteobacteria bacterium]
MGAVVAIDGPSASGKGTLAKKIAAKLGFAHLDTGSLYRFVALKTLENNLDETAPEKVIALARAVHQQLVQEGLSILDTDAIRTEEVSVMTSKTSAIPGVREILRDIQLGFAANPRRHDGSSAKGAVIDGRDIGTVICPLAEAKLFVTASTEERARRRHAELRDRGLPDSYEAILKDMQERDERDRNRPVSPTIPATDAFVLDTTDMTRDAALEKALQILLEKGLE